MNRMTAAVARARVATAALDAETLARLDSTLAIEFDEHFAYQEAQARAHVSGVITADEAMVIYTALGEVGSADNGGWAVGTDTATKVIVTQMVGELLRRFITEGSR